MTESVVSAAPFGGAGAVDAVAPDAQRLGRLRREGPTLLEPLDLHLSLATYEAGEGVEARIRLPEREFQTGAARGSDRTQGST